MTTTTTEQLIPADVAYWLATGPLVELADVTGYRWIRTTRVEAITTVLAAFTGDWESWGAEGTQGYP